MVRAVAAYKEARKLEEQYAKTKWDEFKGMIKVHGYPIKKDNGHEMFLSIEGESKADIEIFQITKNADVFAHIELWYYEFEKEKLTDKYYQNPTRRYSSLLDAISYINKIYDDIKLDKEFKN